MAEVLLRSHAGEYFDVVSAGTSPEGIDRRTLGALKRLGLATEGLRSKSISEFSGQHFDFVITLCSKARQECANFPEADEQIAWDFADPKSREGIASFEVTLRELSERIKIFVLVQAPAEKAAP
jgi:ArsR family transcriptional regulator